MLSERLKQLRHQRGVSQAQIAAILGVSRVNYNRYENNQRTPDEKTMVKIADYFDASLDYLLGRIEGLPPLPTRLAAPDGLEGWDIGVTYAPETQHWPPEARAKLLAALQDTIASIQKEFNL